MTDKYSGLRKLAEISLKSITDDDWWSPELLMGRPAIYDPDAFFIAAASPDVVLGLLNEIARLKGECDFFSARSEEERTNRGLAEKDFHDAMELVRKYSAERDEAREVVKRLADALEEIWKGGLSDTQLYARDVLDDSVVRKIVEGA